MTAGLAWNEDQLPYTDPNNDCIRMNQTNDPIAYAMGREVVAAPGSEFVYNSGLSIALGEIIHRISGWPVDNSPNAIFFIRSASRITPGGHSPTVSFTLEEVFICVPATWQKSAAWC